VESSHRARFRVVVNTTQQLELKPGARFVCVFTCVCVDVGGWGGGGKAERTSARTSSLL
jgi:hypothetical protein